MTDLNDTSNLLKGRVLQSTGSWYEVETENGRHLQARLRGKMRLEGLDVTNPVAVGDIVYLQEEDDHVASISGVQQRRNVILREATKKGKKNKNQIIAANIDLAIAVQAAAQPNPKPGFIDRFLVTCEAYDVAAAIVFNKYDLRKGKNQKQVEQLTEIYRSLGYPVLLTSMYDEESIQAFSDAIKNQLVVMVGHSGVGKSSLINTIDPSIKLKTADVSRASEKGRHTTTFARLHYLSNGTKLVDTPGIREFGLVNVEPEELSLFFPELKHLREECKFYNCTHTHEPGCGIIEKLESGEISNQRYNSYLNILDELQKEKSG